MYTLLRLSFVFIFLSTVCSPIVSSAQSINAVWGQSTIGSTDFIKTDPDGNVFRTSFKDSLLVKIDTDGHVIWSIPFPAQPVDSAAIIQGLAVDGDGNAYIVGSFKSGNITLGSTTLHADTTGRHSSLFMVKYNTNGLQVWAITAAVNASAQAVGIAADQEGDLFISGNLSGHAAFFGSTAVDDSLFHVKYDTDGDVVWAKGIFGEAIFMGGVTVDADGNSIITGNYGGSICTTASTTLTNSGNTTDIFIIKFSPSGNVVWAKSKGTASADDWVRSIDVDGDANVYLSGTHRVNSLFLKKLDDSGNDAWEVYAYNASCTYIAAKVCTDPQGNVYMAGFFIGPELILGSTTLETIGTGNQLFVASFNSAGNIRWAGVADNCIGEQLESDNNGHVYLTGNMNGATLSLGSVVLANNSAHGNSRFLAKLSQDNIATGIFSAENKLISLSPNPTSGKVLVNGLKEGHWKMEVHAINGQLVYSTTFSGTQTDADLTSYPKGLYVLKLKSDEDLIMTGKIIVE
ncbi:MAG: C-terminal target protein [Chitinophagaceae bacterium]|nr:C-terminal target protein [Chitinophagaceae bacterium]